MSDLLLAEHIGLHPNGPTLSLGVPQGQSLCVTGPASSGKSRLLAIFSRQEKPAQGKIHAPQKISAAAQGELPGRTKPQSLARKGPGANKANLAAEVLSALRLWDVRQSPLSSLSSGQVVACQLIEPLMSDAELLIVDGHFDHLDPWALAGVWELLRRRLANGSALVASTIRPDLMAHFDALIVLKQGAVAFAGTVDELVRQGEEQEIRVTTENRTAVRAIVSPFEVSVRDTPEGIVFQAAEAQQLAAKLLLDGYGDVQFVVLGRKSIEEALLSLR